MIEREELFFEDVSGWHDWLLAHHDSSPGVWLTLTRKGGTATTLTYEEAVLEAEGRMQPAGRAAVEAARADGRWPVSPG